MRFPVLRHLFYVREPRLSTCSKHSLSLIITMSLLLRHSVGIVGIAGRVDGNSCTQRTRLEGRANRETPCQREDRGEREPGRKEKKFKEKRQEIDTATVGCRFHDQCSSVTIISCSPYLWSFWGPLSRVKRPKRACRSNRKKISHFCTLSSTCAASRSLIVPLWTGKIYTMVGFEFHYQPRNTTQDEPVTQDVHTWEGGCQPEESTSPLTGAQAGDKV